MENPRNLNLSWTVVSFSNNTLVIQINFEDLQQISSDLEGYDLLNIVINSTDLFSSETGLMLDSMFLNFTKKIPRQLRNGDESSSLEIAAEVGKQTAFSVLAVQLFTNIFISGSLSFLLGSLGAFQLITHLPIMNILVPSNAMEYFKHVVPIVTFDILSAFDQYNDFLSNMSSRELDFEEEEKLNISDQIQELGYDTHNVYVGIGSLCVVITLLFMKTILLILIWPFKFGFERCKKKYKLLKSQLFFNDIFSITFDGYFGILLCCYFNFEATHDNINNNFANHSISFSFMIILVFFVPGSLIYIQGQPSKVLSL